MTASGIKCFGMGRGAFFTPFGARARASFWSPATNARSADDLETAFGLRSPGTQRSHDAYPLGARSSALVDPAVFHIL
jgi:hypothetical protein